MVSAVRSRPNHYEVLGVRPTATVEEITEAFARKMSLFGAHLMAEAPQISVAYETLRNAARRRDYDRTIGLHIGPEPRAWGFTVAPPRWMPVVASTSPAQPAQTPEPHVELRPRPEEPLSPRAAAVGASLRELATPPAREPVERRQRLDTRSDPTEPLIQHILETGRMERDRLYEERDRAIDWRKPAMAAGGLLIGAGLIGGIAGFSVKDNAQSAKTEPVLSVALPDAKAPTDALPASAQPDSLIPPELPRTAAVPKARRSPAPQRSTAWADEIAKGLSVDAPAVEQAAATDGQVADVVQASLPLSKSVIARTIERIGYSCGDVASTAPAASGAFIVTCSSGGTYQAKPVRGRYHFRRVAG